MRKSGIMSEMKKNYVIAVLFILWIWFVVAYFMADKKIFDYSKDAVIARDELEQLKDSGRCDLTGWYDASASSQATPSTQTR
jgi:hypothetical protein